MIIKNTKNRIFKNIIRLRDKKFCNKNNLFLVEGKKHINEIPKDWIIKQIFISKEYKNNLTDFGSRNIITLSERLFNKL
jgi:hypothetical protein